MTEDTPNRNTSFRRLVRRLLFLAACGFGAFFVFLAVLIVPDQVRTIPEPKIDLGLRSVAMDDDRATSSALEAETRDTPPMRLGAVPDAKGRVLSLDEHRKRVRPIPDPSQVPEDLRPAAEEWNRSMDDLTSRVLSLAVESEEMGWEEARLALRNIFKQSLRSRSRYGEKFPPQVGSGEGLWEDGQDAWTQTWMAVRLQIALDKEQWRETAQCCAFFVGLPDPDKTSPWWPAEIYYWKKCGWMGRCFLAYRSASPIVVPIAVALEGPTEGILKPAENVLVKISR
ncbi:hypothetical protein JW916_16665 [Candidatus Sumerlaeota bacterium]|nr:hypothetical protein [Candidatus Sumerlaeota bacterium]